MPSLQELWELPENGPEPTMDKCIRCKGKGYYHSSGFTSNASKNKGECYLCKGRQEYPSNYYTQCLKCKGKGFWYKEGLIGPWTKTGAPCTNCEGAGYQKIDPDNELKPMSCLMCKGRGQYHHKGWCHQGLTQWIKGDCPCCEGKGVLIGNYSRCKRCKGKGAFGKKGVISVWQKPEFIEKSCEDCEGKGFIKEEEPVEDEEESVDTDEDSDMKNQPDEEVDYGGLQPGDDVNYYGDEPEDSKSKTEDKKPEPVTAPCIRCKGLGIYGSSGWTKLEKYKKGDCPLCEGKRVYNENYYDECFKCSGKGFFNSQGSCNIWSKTGVKCTNCQGVGYKEKDFETELEVQKCLMCKGKGHYSKTTWCTQEFKTKQGDCPLCEGKGQLYGNFAKCKPCKGKGGFGTKAPVSIYQKTRSKECEECSGKGFIGQDDPGSDNDSESSEEQQQPEEDTGYGGKQPKEDEEEQEDDKDKEKEENEEEEKPDEDKKEEEEPVDDGFEECPRCGGKGHWNAFGWCEQTKPNKKGDCPLCKGKAKIENDKWRECKKCDKKGFFMLSRTCEIWETRWESRQPCSCCNEIGFLPTRPESKLKTQECLLCEGKGHYKLLGFCPQNKRKENYHCPLCLGKTEIYGDYTKCDKCDGNGAMNAMGPCPIYKNSPSKENCTSCEGKGYTRPTEQDDIEKEEEEKYGYINRPLIELPEIPRPPPGEGGECCIIL